MATSITVSRIVDAEPDAVFSLLSDPRRHSALDGSDMVRGAVEGQPLTTVGQVFTMDMYQPQLGEYQTENTVTLLDPGHSIGWATALPGQPLAGQRWEWTAELDGAGSLVTHVYDWSRMTPENLARVRPPRVSPEQMRGSLDRLAAALMA